VLDNITYGLRYHRNDDIASEKWVKWLMNQLGLTPLADRSVKNLSGGESQRVALARALAVNPSVLLLDEPLSALDPNFREEIREVLKRLHKEVGITFLMVTHDFAEALFLGERMAVIHQGKVEQTGAVAEVFQRPSTPFVAEFVGMKNIFPVIFDKGKALMEELVLKVEAAPAMGSGHIAIRPEDIVLRKVGVSENGINLLRAKVLNIIQRGPYYEVSAGTGKIVFQTILSKSDLLEMMVTEERDVYLAIRTTDIHVF
jgi:molybdate/tungstate transport system ATP-binding protein